jgi:hypothetical protein
MPTMSYLWSKYMNAPSRSHLTRGLSILMSGMHDMLKNATVSYVGAPPHGPLVYDTIFRLLGICPPPSSSLSLTATFISRQSRSPHQFRMMMMMSFFCSCRNNNHTWPSRGTRSMSVWFGVIGVCKSTLPYMWATADQQLWSGLARDTHQQCWSRSCAPSGCLRHARVSEETWLQALVQRPNVEVKDRRLLLRWVSLCLRSTDCGLQKEQNVASFGMTPLQRLLLSRLTVFSGEEKSVTKDFLSSVSEKSCFLSPSSCLFVLCCVTS